MFASLAPLVFALFAQPLGGDIVLDYDFDLRHEQPSEITIEIRYNQDAAWLLGPPDSMADGAFRDPVWDTPGASFVESEADASDPDEQRVRITGTADGPDAIQSVIENDFYDVTVQGEGDVLEVTLAPGGEGQGVLAVDGLEITGLVVLQHDGARTSLSGGDEVDERTLEWDPFGSERLEVTIDLSGETGAGGLDLEVILAVVVLLLMIIAGVVVFLVVRRRRARSQPAGPAAYATGPPETYPPAAAPAPPPTQPGAPVPPPTQPGTAAAPPTEAGPPSSTTAPGTQGAPPASGWAPPGPGSPGGWSAPTPPSDPPPGEGPPAGAKEGPESQGPQRGAT